MDTIALRFTNNLAPDCGTIKAHEAVIQQNGYVWYGKFGSSVSKPIREMILSAETPKVLLIHSGTANRYWAYIEDISSDTPPLNEFPSYYINQANRCGSWLKVIRFEKADPGVLSKCFVRSSGTVLSNASRHSMSPYFIIRYEGE